ncbi:SNF2 family N-terminal domain-containing protein [Mycena sanguinolenta]|nr:SNF2 family N-terminal domain-containing protein [Mycena sanguinolenta]
MGQPVSRQTPPPAHQQPQRQQQDEQEKRHGQGVVHTTDAPCTPTPTPPTAASGASVVSSMLTTSPPAPALAVSNSQLDVPRSLPAAEPQTTTAWVLASSAETLFAQAIAGLISARSFSPSDPSPSLSANTPPPSSPHEENVRQAAPPAPALNAPQAQVRHRQGVGQTTVTPRAPTPTPPAGANATSGASNRVIDLTGSPSPPRPPVEVPQVRHGRGIVHATDVPRASTPTPTPPVGANATSGASNRLAADLPAKTVVCIGQLGVTALVLHSVPYLLPHSPGHDEWAAVRLQYEHNPNEPGGAETIHIKAPRGRAANSEQFLGEAFGEQKVATALGPMFGKGLIRLDAKVRKGPPNLPTLPLQMLVYTPKGNIPVVGPEIATKLYPHQKKALTFLLEREREKMGADGTFSSLWQKRTNNHRPGWFHTITTKEVFQEPQETKCAILADDTGLGKAITCVSLIAATLVSAREFAAAPADPPSPPSGSDYSDSASNFSGSVCGMPEDMGSTSKKAQAKAQRTRASRIKSKSHASLIICPLSTVSNWEDQFREHWKGEVVVGGAGGCVPATPSQAALRRPSMFTDAENPSRGHPLRVYIYHGTAHKPDPAYLADFDAVITTYATLASEFSKENRSIASADAEDDEDDDGGSRDGGGVEIDERGKQLPKAKKGGLKRKKSGFMNGATECVSALQSIHWFRVILDEGHSIKETSTVGSRACCDLTADRRLCLTGTPVQNKLDDVFALIKFLRLDPLDDKNVWTEYIGNPVKFGQDVGVARLQIIMKCITLRRTKESRNQDGTKILDLPPRRDELRYLKFDEREQSIYNEFFNEPIAEVDDLADKNEVMKNYVGTLQKILRLRQICDHYELVEGKDLRQQQDAAASYEIVADISRDGINPSHAAAIFAMLREFATTQCGECGAELWPANDLAADAMDVDGPSAPKRARKTRGDSSSGGTTRTNSPCTPRPVLTRCQHLFCVECYQNCICPGWPNVASDVLRSCSACQAGLSPSDAVEIQPDSISDLTAEKKPPKREKRQKGVFPDNFHPSTKLKALMGDLVQFSKANPYSGNYDSESIEVQMVDNEGNPLDDGVVKSVVFSQWTGMLDKIEDALEMADIRYHRLDDTMKRDDRTHAMDALKHDPRCEVLLVNLKPGGVDLNLTAARRVYLMEPFWNSAVENQAIDYIYRLGQTRPVTTVTMIIEKSIEARMLETRRKKTALANMTLGQSFSKSELMSRRQEELAELFGQCW